MNHGALKSLVLRVFYVYSSRDNTLTVNLKNRYYCNTPIVPKAAPKNHHSTEFITVCSDDIALVFMTKKKKKKKKKEFNVEICFEPQTQVKGALLLLLF